MPTGASSRPLRLSHRWTPIVDGALVRGPPLELARSGKLRPSTPIITGHNLNDGGGFVPTTDDGWGYLRTRAELLEYFARRFGPNRVEDLLRAAHRFHTDRELHTGPRSELPIL